MRDFIKCVQPTLPRAANAVFGESLEGNLIYIRVEYDLSRELSHESGHNVLQLGDSGSPFWTEVFSQGVNQSWGNPGRGKRTKIAALVALNIGGQQTGNDHVLGQYLDNPEKKCRQWVIKITSDIRDWLVNIEQSTLREHMSRL